MTSSPGFAERESRRSTFASTLSMAVEDFHELRLQYPPETIITLDIIAAQINGLLDYFRASGHAGERALTRAEVGRAVIDGYSLTLTQEAHERNIDETQCALLKARLRGIVNQIAEDPFQGHSL